MYVDSILVVQVSVYVDSILVVQVSVYVDSILVVQVSVYVDSILVVQVILHDGPFYLLSCTRDGGEYGIADEVPHQGTSGAGSDGGFAHSST